MDLENQDKLLLILLKKLLIQDILNHKTATCDWQLFLDELQNENKKKVILL